jgi:NADH-quinone oxidoreductase subunit J
MDAINWHSFFFLVFATVACVFAVAVVVSSNIVRMAFYLVVSLGAVAGLFFLAGADFVAAVQMMIYVGGTMVLLAFGVMLTAQGPAVTMKIARGQWVLAVMLGGALLAVLVWAAFSVDDWAHRKVARGEVSEELEPTATRLGLGLLSVRVDKQDQEDPTLRKGMSGYLLPFEIVSVHLLVVLIGAAYLARARKRVVTDEGRVVSSDDEG